MRWCLLAGLLVAACFAPRAPAEVPCGENGSCPSGQKCTPAGICSSMPFEPGPDAADPDAPIAPPDSSDPDAPPGQTTMSFGERAGSINDTWVDTFLENGSVGDNMGIHVDLHLTGEADQPILIRIDVSAIPSGATVVAARLKFRVTSDTIDAGTTIDVFAMNESWTEGTESFEAGVSNYTERNAGMLWSTAGALPPSRGNTAVATAAFAATVPTGGDFEIVVPAALIAGWVATPSSNNGIAMMVSGNGGFYCELGSSEANGMNSRPALEVDVQQ